MGKKEKIKGRQFSDAGKHPCGSRHYHKDHRGSIPDPDA